MRKILVIDDSPTVASTLDTILTPRGFDVYIATDGLAGLNALTAFDPDLVILDIMLPLVDGFGWLETIRHYEKHATLPVIMLSGLKSDEDIERALRAGASDYLIKPVNPEKLVNSIEAAITQAAIA